MNSERQTRQEKIDLQLGRAGWAMGSRRLIEEFLVESTFRGARTERRLPAPETSLLTTHYWIVWAAVGHC